MIVRTYGRRSRGGGNLTRTYSDSSADDAVADHNYSFSDSFSLSQETTQSNQDFCSHNFPFSSQDSTSYSLDLDPFNFDDNPIPNGVVPRKSKKPRCSKSKSERNGTGNSNLLTSSTTLMEAQEFGEMMEHVDEVNFALDGLKKGQPLRIKRASLLSLLGICGTQQQRRLLRTEGMAKTIIDAILGLSLDDSTSNLAAAALFYVLTSDGQDEHLLESPTCIRFLIKLLKPIFSTATEDKTRNIGSKLLALRKDSDILRDPSKLADSSSSAIAAKVQEILVNCKDMKSHSGDDSRMERPELTSKWIALLSMEKACLSKISFEDTSGMVRKTGGGFKEKLRELGGLDAVFEVTMNCYSVIERWTEHNSSSIHDAKDDMHRSSLVLLLKCLKIMENATFLSNDNQTHLLGMRGNSDSHGHRLSFTKIIISIIKILSSLHLLKSSPAASFDGNHCSLSERSDNASDLALIDDDRDSNGVICISSSPDCCNEERTSSGKGSNVNCCKEERTSSGKRLTVSQNSIGRLSLSASSSETATRFMKNTCQLKMRVPSMPISCSETLRSYDSNRSRTKFGLVEKTNCTKDACSDMLDDSQDPYAFDEDDFQPTKWDVLSGKRKISRTRNGSRATPREVENGCQYKLTSQEESSNGLHKSSNREHHHSLKSSYCNVPDEEHSSLLADCLLTAIKVLMNLTNDNPTGCQQIAACGGLETMSSLIAGHFPLFSSSISFFGEMQEDSLSIPLKNQNDIHLTDQQLDLLVAILGLLVNLVEKDGNNRSRLAATSVSLSSSEGSEDESRKDVIPLLCSIFLANQGAGDAAGEGSIVSWNDEAAVLQGEKEAEKMIVEAYSALLLAFLSTESKSIHDSIAECLPNHNLAVLVPVLERFVAFHLTLNMISSETHKAVSEVIESCRIR
ncbi:WINGS APART-LIKE PROTEIN-like protein [Salix koriyanagi]|uniref:WINGS APART-LIKE PROTEIN-like protein n=1 Tax=Salix koriyanagi TaxID=2511006 RepID=A0A9Q0ZBP9_9ROSI|nr:WINGS APART-LIKE PROTEIN-like protein [Salix koriyanagi]